MSLRNPSGLLLALLPLLCLPAWAEDRCVVCGAAPIGGVVYLMEDKVTHQKVVVCETCSKSFNTCYVCGLPASTNTVGFVPLGDGRVLCGRDAKSAVITEQQGFNTFVEVRDGVDRLFSRFTRFPTANITLAMVDRIHLLDLFKLAGNDYHCPNVLGYTESVTNNHKVEHHISLMTGLPRSWLQAVSAHELTHAWVTENVSPARKQTLARDAEEGFCELVAWLYSKARGDEEEKNEILRNAYTRGQIDLFVAAEAVYGFNDVLDWMRYGIDDRLSAADPGRLHEVKLPEGQPSSMASIAFVRPEPRSGWTNLVLKAVFWDPNRPLALINDHTFGLQEEAKLRVGTSNLLVRCVGIQQTGVRIRVAGVAQEQELSLKAK